MSHDFTRIAIVNRGEPAIRFIRAVRDFNRRFGTSLRTIALFTGADRRARFVREADEALDLDDGPATESRRSPYVDLDRLMRALATAKAQGVWVGWGFVSESPEFADRCERAGLTFIGPPASAIRLLGDKISAKRLASQVGIPVTPWGGGAADTLDTALAQAQRLGAPLVIKPAGGAGGRAVRRAATIAEVPEAWSSAVEEARKTFGTATVFLERWMSRARHVEVQVAADRQGTTWAIDVRDCSLQRRHQKILEESPALAVPPEVDRSLREAAVRLCRAAGYQNVGTVEFLYEPSTRQYTFMEVNARMQVEHAVTELTTGLDLVVLQIALARGVRLEGAPPVSRGHAVEVRINAEDAENNFAAAPGTLRTFRVPTRPGLRLDAGVAEGDEISPEYDSMFAKLVALGTTRDEAIATLSDALADSSLAIAGGLTNRAFLMHILGSEDVVRGPVHVDWLDDLATRQQHVSRAHGDVALLAAALDVYDSEFNAERDEFFASAARFRPVVRREIGRAIEFRHRGHRYDLKVFRLGSEHYRVDVDGLRVDLRSDVIQAGRRLITYAGTRYKVLTAVQGMTHLVEVGSTLHRVSRDEAGIVRAFSPAVVVNVTVKPGDRVSAGDRIALLEAMKMETPVLSPCAGTVRDVFVLGNAQVGTGTPLVHIDPEAGDATGEPGERVTFKGEGVPASRGGRPATRTRAIAAGVRAFAEALAPVDVERIGAVLDDVRDLMLGSDIDAAEAKRLVEEYRGLCERLPVDDEMLARREEEVLQIFADVTSLFRRQPEQDDPNEAFALSAGQYFLTYLRMLEAKGSGLPTSFVGALERALRHYGGEALEVTNAHKSRLLWMYKFHERVDQQVGAAIAILERRLRRSPELQARTGVSFLELLDRLIESSEDQFPPFTDLARDVRYRYFDQPIFDRGRQALYADMEGHLAHLMRDPDTFDRAERIRALVDCPVPLSNLLSGRFEDAAPVFREVMLEVLTRRYYRIRTLERFDARELDGRSTLTADYEADGRHFRLVATHAPWERLAEALAAIRPVVDTVEADHEVVVDVYVWRGTPEGEPVPDADATAAALAERVCGAAFARPVRRVSIAIAGPRGEWATSGTGHFTFRTVDGTCREDRLVRGVHPLIGKRLQLWRLEHFTVERLPSVEDVYLFRAVARENPKDERLVALAEIRDVTAVRDSSGALLQVPHLERMMLEALAAIREFQFRRSPEERLHWNRVVLYVWPLLAFTRDELLGVMKRVSTHTEGLGLEKMVLRGDMPDADTGQARPVMLSLANPGGRGIVLTFDEPRDQPLKPLEEYTQKVVRMRQRGLTYPYEVVRMLTPGREHTESDLPPGEFIEYDLDASKALVPVQRPWGKNTANIVVGVIRTFTAKYPEGMTRVALLGDASREMGSLSEPECRRILAAMDLAESMHVPLEWFALSAGAKISMESGTENMDWISLVLRRIIEFTQRGHEINVVVTGINVGAQPYWNAEATMLTHTKGILVMMPESAMVLTGKTALDYSGSVSADDNLGIGGYERIMGPNGQAQYWARDLDEACQILLRHYDHSYVVPGERFPRRATTTDVATRDVCTFPHGRTEGTDFQLVGDIFSDATNPGRKKPFDIRRVMLAVSDQDHAPLERWAGWRDAEVGVIWDAHVGGIPVCLLGFESRSVSRLGFVPTDGPDHWTSGTLFPMASKKIARAINAASANRPLVVLANLSGFDGSPESMRRRQLEFGAEIGRAITNFKGPIVFVVISRYHGGAFVVFSKTLHDNMQVAALEGTYASVIGGAPAAAVVFAREVDVRTRKDARVQALEKEIAAADEETKRRLRPRLAALMKSVRSEKLGEVADEFDRVHSVHRALKVGSLDRILPARELRPFLIQAVEAGMARELERLGAMETAAPGTLGRG